MSREALLAGARRLCTALYEPEHYGRRMLNLIDRYGGTATPARPVRAGGRRRALQMFRRISAQGAREARMVANVLRQAGRKPAALPTVMHFLGRYEQARHVLDHVPDRSLAAA